MNDWASKSFWLGATPYRDNPPLEEDIRADVAIVGAGFTGLSTAWYLRQADPPPRVVVVESDVVGYGASGRNAGVVTAQMGTGLRMTSTATTKRTASSRSPPTRPRSIGCSRESAWPGSWASKACAGWTHES
jgi:glycine/D-amino acid oxidase-like deaminating enzyme